MPVQTKESRAVRPLLAVVYCYHRGPTLSSPLGPAALPSAPVTPPFLVPLINTNSFFLLLLCRAEERRSRSNAMCECKGKVCMRVQPSIADHPLFSLPASVSWTTSRQGLAAQRRQSISCRQATRSSSCTDSTRCRRTLGTTRTPPIRSWTCSKRKRTLTTTPQPTLPATTSPSRPRPSTTSGRSCATTSCTRAVKNRVGAARSSACRL